MSLSYKKGCVYKKKVCKTKDKPEARTRQDNGAFIKDSGELKLPTYPSSIPWKNANSASSRSRPELIQTSGGKGRGGRWAEG